MTPPWSVNAGNRRLDQGEGSEDVRVVHRAQVGGQVVGERGLRARTEPAGVVDQNPRRSCIDRGDDQRCAVGGVGDIAGDGDEPRRVQLLGRRLQVGRAPGIGHHRPAPVEQGCGQGAAEAARRARDDRDGRDVVEYSHTGILIVEVNFKSRGGDERGV